MEGENSHGAAHQDGEKLFGQKIRQRPDHIEAQQGTHNEAGTVAEWTAKQIQT